MTTPAQRVAARHFQRHLKAAGGLELVTAERRGYAYLMKSNDTPLTDIVKELNQWMIPKLHGAPTTVPGMKNAVKAFSFHWSNAQAKWDVIPARKGEFPFSQDGADFIMFLSDTALSPLGSLWTLTEMKYVAKALRPHPGYAESVEGGRSFLAGL